MLPEGYVDPAAMKDKLLRMWSAGKADMHDVMEILRMSRASVMYAALEGYGLHLEGDENAEEKGAEFARLIEAAKDDGTRH
ncbi:hypothetical protein [Sinorhizobium medicae]|uniref:hypothetical protein n=1 Tax=Sinorhizobium medicae TaxID=110321 RepID=UPI000FD9F62D|nr:hypothetical protein [Sinorhizobium medicae]RVP47350.1 hypothetical protein CN078_26915 [Sinorhizobium medicae]RVP75453.1 hypothetical protein CN079_20170 [Sinorhizobium medicae]UWU06571.1 hypothetical protein N2598_09250 [Sinorhizobium medicae]